MDRKIRDKYNELFGGELDLHACIEKYVDSPIDNQFSRTPVFIDDQFIASMEQTCQSIVRGIEHEDLVEESRKYMPQENSIINESSRPTFMSIDFAVCEGEDGKKVPKLVEVQGFPSVFGFTMLAGSYFLEKLTSTFSYSWTLPGMTEEKAMTAFSKAVLGGHNEHSVVLVDFEPELQKTNFDFKLTEAMLGVKPVCLKQLKRKGRKLYYLNEGKEILIERIYNRIIFEKLGRKTKEVVAFFNSVDVEWTSHPNWYYLLSKASLPFISDENNPYSNILSEVDYRSLDLTKFVVKPLFDFGGRGVIMTPTMPVLDMILDKESYLIQEKIEYAKCIRVPSRDRPLMVEFRIMYAWPQSYISPVPVSILSRLSDGRTLGPNAHMNTIWTGATVGLCHS